MQELREVHAWMREHGEAAIASLKPLSYQDMWAVGALVQLFAYADLTGRRILEHLRAYRGEERPSFNKAPRDTDVLGLVAEACRDLPLTEEEHAAVERRIKNMDGFQVNRNHAAHWAARMYPHGDVFVFMTMNAREAKRRTGHELSEFALQYALAPGPALRSSIDMLQEDVEWLSGLMQELWERFPIAR